MCFFQLLETAHKSCLQNNRQNNRYSPEAEQDIIYPE